jgi:GNAT superfamily N-acetyltransferase
LECSKIEKGDKNLVLQVLFESKKPPQSQIIDDYFKNKWLGYGGFVEEGNHLKMIAYCFVKNPKTRPETLTVVHSQYRNNGIATKLRDWVLEQREFLGNIVYSASELNNPASIKSLLKSGYQVFDVTKSGHLQFIKLFFYKT